VIGSFYSCGVLGAPWIIEKNYRRPEQFPTAMLVFGSVFLIALLFWHLCADFSTDKSDKVSSHGPWKDWLKGFSAGDSKSKTATAK
jgi:hypothetical protein